MVILSAFLALLAGFSVMAVLVMVVTAALTRLTPDWVDPARSNSPSTAYVFVNLGYSFIAAAAGGYVTAWLAWNNPLYQVLALAFVVLALAALSAIQLYQSFIVALPSSVPPPVMAMFVTSCAETNGL